MPYGRFLRACDQTGYDFTVLQRRFGVSFEQLAHRLTTLQRVGQRGLPFFMARLDRAGQFSKRFSGASGATLLESDSTCPLWIAHRAFDHGELCVQPVRSSRGEAGPSHWLTVAKTVNTNQTSTGARFVIVLGLTLVWGSTFCFKGLALDLENAEPIGLGCARCFREGCRQRSLPPRRISIKCGSIGERVDFPFEFRSFLRLSDFL